MESSTSVVATFAQSASQFCELVEQCDRYESGDFFHRVRMVLPLLYHQAMQLPETSGDSQTLNRTLTHEEWCRILSSLSTKLGECDTYWVIFAPTQLEPESPVCGSLNDDIADIYRDLKNGLIHWAAGDEKLRESVVWEWKFSFETHWSHHLVNALRVMTWLVHNRGMDPTRY